MDDRESGGLEAEVLGRIEDGDLDLADASLAEVRERLAAETGSETWAAENVGPFHLLARVAAINEEMAAVDALPSASRVESWRSDLDAAVDDADDAWGRPTVEIAAFVPEIAGDLRSVLSSLFDLLDEHGDYAAEFGEDDPRVERHGELVREHFETAVRATRPFDDGTE